MESTRYFVNDLIPVPIDEASLKDTRSTLQDAILKGLKLIERVTRGRASGDESIYTGSAGIAFMYMRLMTQGPVIQGDENNSASYLKRISAHLADANTDDLRRIRPGRVSPVDSPVGPATARIMYATLNSASSTISKTDYAILAHAVKAAMQDDTRTNEILYGKAGLLFALLQIRSAVVSAKLEDEELTSLVTDEVLKNLVTSIVRDGQLASSDSSEFPLNYEWHGKCYLGTMHGIAGILTILIQCPLEFIQNHRTAIMSTVNSLLRITQKNEGHLPSSVSHRERSSYVQICHGSPGLLLLLATLEVMLPEWTSEIDPQAPEILSKASDRIWEEGILKKGISLCHGVTGNAWPWLLLVNAELRSNKFTRKQELSRALAFLLHSVELPPMPSHSSPYRMPDNPYSLFEGLAGAVCCWSEGCVLISRILEETKEPLLGFPAVGGVGTTGRY